MCVILWGVESFSTLFLCFIGDSYWPFMINGWVESYVDGFDL